MHWGAGGREDTRTQVQGDSWQSRIAQTITMYNRTSYAMTICHNYIGRAAGQQGAGQKSGRCTASTACLCIDMCIVMCIDMCIRMLARPLHVVGGVALKSDHNLAVRRLQKRAFWLLNQPHPGPSLLEQGGMAIPYRVLRGRCAYLL